VRLARKLWAPVPWMLEATVVLESALGKWLDATIILAVLSLNTVLGIVQERRAEAAVEMLRTRLECHVRVGDFVPADLLLQSGSVMADQSALTGEGNPRRGQDPCLGWNVRRIPSERVNSGYSQGSGVDFSSLPESVPTAAAPGVQREGRSGMRSHPRSSVQAAGNAPACPGRDCSPALITIGVPG
jgi:magnesium-transporting ATPase (P-type)